MAAGKVWNRIVSARQSLVRVISDRRTSRTPCAYLILRDGVQAQVSLTPVGDFGPKPPVGVLIETWVGLNAAIMSHDPIVRPERTGIIHYELPEDTPSAAVDEGLRSAVIRDAGTQGEWPVHIEFQTVPGARPRWVRYEITYRTGQYGQPIV